MVDIAAVRIGSAGSAAFLYSFYRWLFESRLLREFFIQTVQIALHTLLNFNFYINPAFSGHVGRDVASIRSHRFPIYEAAGNTPLYNFLKHFLEKIALLPFACSGFAESGVIRNCLIQLKTAEPTVSEIEPHFLLQPAF